MGINKTKNALLSVCIFIVCTATQCDKAICNETSYSFALGVTAKPDNEIIKVGDTIWLEINESNQLRELSNSSVVAFSGAVNLGSVFGIIKFGPNGEIIEALKKINLKLLTGQTVDNYANPDLFSEFLFIEENDHYKFKLGISPKDTGVYRVGFSDAANVYRKNDMCTKAYFTINFQNTNQHHALNPNYTGSSMPAGGDYYFKVVN